MTCVRHHCLQVINETCVEITSVEPSQICLSDIREQRIKHVTLNGRGFHSILDEEKALCRFKTVDGRYLGEYLCAWP